MLPFCGYDMADYFGHWLESGRREGAELPEDLHGQLVPKGRRRQVHLARVRREQPRAGLDLQALRRRGGRSETPIGLVPSTDALDTEGLDLSPDAMGELLKVDTEEWKAQLPQMHEHFAQFGDDLPDPLRRQLELLEERLG